MNNWEKIKLNELGDIVTGNTPSTYIPQYYDGQYMFVSPVDIKDNAFIRNTEKKLTKAGLNQTRVIPKGSICVVCIGSTIGKMAITTDLCATNQQINTIVPFERELSNFFYYLLQQYLIPKLNIEAGLQAVPIVNKSSFANIEIPIPPPPQQRKIAKILTTLDHLIEKTEAAIAKYQAIKQGMMQDLFTRGIGADGRLRPRFADAPELYQETVLGWMPREWEVKNILEVSENGFKNGYFKKPELVGKGLKLINVTDIYQSFGIDTNHKKVERVEVSNTDYTKYKAIKGDLFFTRSSLVLSGIAKCNILRNEKEKTVFECHVMMLRPNNKLIDSDYLALYCLTGRVRNLFMSYAKQVAMTTISQDDMSRLPVLLPKYKEQKEISKKIVQIEDLINKEKQTLQKLQTLKKGLMQDLLTGKVPVQVAEEIVTQLN